VPLSSIPTIIDDIRAGKMVILMDDEDRENEGDLIIAAEKVTPEIINFFATEACGLICMPITVERARQLRLPLMVRDNRAQHETNFTVSIDASEQVGPGISAAQRAHTILEAVRRDAGPGSIRQPGHVFPLVAKPGGVLKRAGHTEAGVDLARMAGARTGSGDRRNHEPGWHHGAPSGAGDIRRATWARNGHHRRSDRVPVIARAVDQPAIET
jgi:3,4-dihydroxy 2-butanone 4-phosphate synthase/GTP cyclohydrolase II